MTNFSDIEKSPDRDFTLLEIAQALRTNKVFVNSICKKGLLAYRVDLYKFHDSFLVKGSDVIRYLDKFNEN